MLATFTKAVKKGFAELNNYKQTKLIMPKFNTEVFPLSFVNYINKLYFCKKNE